MSTHLPLTPDHATFLADHAVPTQIALDAGIFSVTSVEQLPEEFAWAGAEAVPAIAFPWRTPSGDTVVQLRPDTPIEVDWDDRPRKYLWPKESGSPIGIAREVDSADTVMFVEGTKQALAAAAYAPAGISVYGIAGCRTWSEDGIPVSDLEVAEDRDVLLCFDADVETNPDVWEAAKKFSDALRAEGANDVRYVILPAGKKAGLDDVLGARAEEKRAVYLERLIDAAAKKLPKRPPKGSNAPSRDEIGTPTRPMIEVNADRHIVIGKITEALAKWDGTRLFNYGGVLSELRGASVEPLNKDKFCAVLAEGSTCVALDARGFPSFQWPDAPTLGAAMTKADMFTELLRVSRMPIVRPDGTVCTTSGYDTDTRTMVLLPEDLEGLTVPSEPTEQEVADALSLIVEDWLYDFMPSLPTDADKANALGLMMTPFIRGLCPLVPLAVVDGLQAGVGKNLLADLLAILVTGENAQPLPYARDDEEVRKVITSAFRSGAELFLFDEAHVVEGPNFARALTSITYKDRVLGVSTMAEYPNNVTWVSLGNQVVVNGDMSRRVYRIALHTAVANPQDRPETAFMHPDIRQWTRDNRSAIVAAFLTLVRAWFAADEPGPAKPISFGSFEVWAKIVGGVLHNAGLEGFLENLIAWRSETDFERTYWADHLRWLHRTFGDDTTFTANAAQRKMLEDPMAEMPPGITSAEGRGFPRELGQVYGRHKSRIVDGLQLVKSVEMAHGNVVKWKVVDVSLQKTQKVQEVGGLGVTGGSGCTAHVRNTVHSEAIHNKNAHTWGEGREDPPNTTNPPAVDVEALNARKLASARFIRAEE